MKIASDPMAVVREVDRWPEKRRNAAHKAVVIAAVELFLRRPREEQLKALAPGRTVRQMEDAEAFITVIGPDILNMINIDLCNRLSAAHAFKRSPRRGA